MKAEEYLKENIPTMLGEHHCSGMKITTLIALLNGFSGHQNKKLIEDHNELLESHECMKQQNIDVHNEWKELKKENKKLIELLQRIFNYHISHGFGDDGSFESFADEITDLL